MDKPNCQTTMPKVLPNQPLFCPWTSKAPLASSLAVRHGSKSLDEQPNSGNLEQFSLNCQYTMINQSCANKDKMNVNGLTNTPKYSSIQQSSSQFFNFLRLMQLFPDVHPATLHTVLVLCKNDFFCAVDKLLYAKKCKQLYNSRRNLVQTCNSTSKMHRHQPYCYARSATNTNEKNHPEQTLTRGNDCLISQGFVGEMIPLDASIKQMETSQVKIINIGKSQEVVLKAKTLEPRKILPRNRGKNRGISAQLPVDLPSVASLQCRLPIRPLSPINYLPEDLSSQSTDKTIS